MEFSISCCGINNEFYYISIGTYQHIVVDKDIAELLDISFKEYKRLLYKFGAIYRINSGGFVFENENNAQKFADYLNEKYLVILRLADKI